MKNDGVDGSYPANRLSSPLRLGHRAHVHKHSALTVLICAHIICADIKCRRMEDFIASEHSWTKEYTRLITATPDALWSILADTSSWKLWNSGVKAVRMQGPFATGAKFDMELPDGEIVGSELISVLDGEHFIDESRVGETIIRVDHRIEQLEDNQCRVVYAVTADGPDAQMIGEAVSEDFPTVLEDLERHLMTVS